MSLSILLELEQQLDHAQDKCHLLEKQLEHMRLMMQNNIPPTSSPSSKHSSYTSHSYASPIQTSSVHHGPTTRQPIASKSHSPTLEKLNALEKEHQKLTESQTLYEVSTQFCIIIGVTLE